MTLSIVSLLAGNVDEAAIDLATHLTRAGIESSFASLAHTQRRRMVETESADIVWMCGWLALEVGRPALEVVAAPTFAGEPPASYRSVVISREPSAGLAELSATSLVWAVNEPESWSGHRALRAECSVRGLAAPTRIVWSGSHLKSIRMVAEGEADAAAIDSTVWRWAGAQGPSVVDATRSWPSPPILVRRDLLDRMPHIPSLITSAFGLRGIDSLDEADWRHLEPMGSGADT